MMDREDLECVVCYHEFCRNGHVPRVLHCNHTFCSHCLQTMSKQEGVIRSICCPLCRWKTCLLANQDLEEALYINTEIWDQIAEEEQWRTSSKPAEDTSVRIRSELLDRRKPGFMSTVKTRPCNRRHLRRRLISFFKNKLCH